MLTADMQRITGFFFHQCYLWVTPISVVIMLLVLWAYVGVAALAGLGTVGLLGVAQLFLVNRSRGQEAAAMRYKDIRQRTIGEIFNDIKILKMYAWEHHFAERAIKMRRDEQDALYRASHYSNVNLAITFITPPLAALITYATYLYIDPNNVLNSRTAFVTLLFLFSVRPSLHMMPQAASLFVQAKLAIDRMAAFLLARELDRSAVEHLAPSDLPRPSHSPPPAVCITDGTFSWYPRSHAGQSAALRDITLRVEEGTLLAIVGGVGSGKSSLLAAMLGLMEKVSGHVTIKGTVAYVTQNAWIQNLSLRDNILFGAEFNEGLYQRVVEACSLSKDLEMLTDGDQTEIGEKGINLSGGQKMRVTLARAVYADADIIILDDPLAAVDAHVGQHIFEHVIGPNGMLQGKTRIFVTNAVNWLPQTDQVVHVEQGRICSIGRYEDLVETDELFRSYLQDSQVDVSEAAGHHHHGANAALTQPTNHLAPYATEADADPRKATPIDGTELRTATKKRHGKETTKLIGVEEFRDGGVTWQTYKLLARNMTYWMVAIVLVGYALGSAFFLVSNTWIGTLTTHNYTLADGSVDQRYKGFGLAIYAVFILAQLIFVAFGLWGVSYGIIKAGRSLHNSMLQRLIRSPMSYFDTTPLGRILNRFSKDIDTIDLTVPSYMRYFLNAFFLSMAFAFLIMIEIPLTIVFVVPLMAALYLVKLFYQKTAMQLTRIDAMKRAPLISSLQQSFAGSNVIVATGNSNRFIAESHQKVDELTAVIHLSNGASQ
ncbi:hypothetical protein RvY_00074-3 [Ramazzottius varieornatus]|uniref:ABC transmembrane type-1 domain-containing protein n=1 Tax=Ramazzottius varieornatus TaxID=947166 RepID=A0A1D1UFM4_RAMVA|nr:hypothetical protein RvY_00074-3 [Ramazzottius varieornatus]